MFHILPEYERAVVSTLGRISGVKGPGLVILIPVLQTMTRVDVRPATVELPNATVTYRVVDPARALGEVGDYRVAMKTLCETAVRSVLADRSADALVFERKGVEDQIGKNLNAVTAPWGVEVEKVEMKR